MVAVAAVFRPRPLTPMHEAAASSFSIGDPPVAAARRGLAREAPVNVSRRGEAFRRMNRRVSHLFAGWRTGLSRPVLILQAGNALNYFGYGLILPFEIIYLHQIRGFSTSIAGLVLAATQGTAAIAAPPTGALLDRYSAKAI